MQPVENDSEASGDAADDEIVEMEDTKPEIIEIECTEKCGNHSHCEKSIGKCLCDEGYGLRTSGIGFGHRNLGIQ